MRRQVAFKVLRRSLAERSENVARFRREARAVAALVHPYIVQVYEVGCLDGIHFAALEDSEPAWLSVSLYFPAGESTQNAYYARRAQQRLAELYREEGRDQEALELYQQLANWPNSATEFRAFGLAGIARVYWERDQRVLALQSLAQLPPLLPGLEAPQREELLAGLGASLRPELERMLRDGRRPGPPPPGNDSRRFSRELIRWNRGVDNPCRAAQDTRLG